MFEVAIILFMVVSAHAALMLRSMTRGAVRRVRLRIWLPG